MTPKWRASRPGDGQAGDGQVGAAVAVEVDHGGVVHLVDVVAGEDQGVAGAGLLDRVDVLVDGVGRPLVPVLGDPLLRRDDLDVLVELAAEEPPALVDVAVQADGLVLGQDEDLAEVAVDAVGEGEVDDAVDAAERDGGLGSIAGQGFEPGPSTAGQHDRQDISQHRTPPKISRLAPPAWAAVKSCACYCAREIQSNQPGCDRGGGAVS